MSTLKMGEAKPNEKFWEWFMQKQSVNLNLEDAVRVPFFKGGSSRNKYHVQKYGVVKGD